MDVRFVVTSEEREACLALRWEVLRAPLGEPRGAEADEREDAAATAFVCDDAGRVVATGRLHEEGPGTGRVRYMAVRPGMQGRGFGRAVLAALEAEARRRGFAEVHLNARIEAVPFYRAQGYADLGEAPTYRGILHRRMGKALPPPGPAESAAPLTA